MEFFPFGPHLTQKMLTQLNPARHSPCEIQRQRRFGQLLHNMIRNAQVHHSQMGEQALQAGAGFQLCYSVDSQLHQLSYLTMFWFLYLQ